MLDRLSFRVVLRVVLLALATVAVLPVAFWSWQSWRSLDASARTLAAADASADAFRVLINIRTDRNTTPRVWAAPEPISPDMRTYMQKMQDQEMTAFRSAVIRLADIDFADKPRLLAALTQSLDRITRLQTEFWAGVDKPKASRRADLGAEYAREGSALQPLLEDISARLFASIRNSDAFVDQMLEIKQLAWLARDNAGEASLLISKGLAAGKVAPDAQRTYDTFNGGAIAAWAAIENAVYGMALPPSLAEAMATAKRVYFAPDYLALSREDAGGPDRRPEGGEHRG